MANSSRYYIGAYLRIQVRKMQIKRHVCACENGHMSSTGRFCPECGTPVKWKTNTVVGYPTDFDDIAPDLYESERLSVVTPLALSGTGLIVAISNTSTDFDVLDTSDGAVSLVPLPTEAEAQAIIDGFNCLHASDIAAIMASSAVESVDTQIGVVLIEEY